MSEWQKIPFDECFELHRNNTCSRAMMAETGAVQNIHYGDILVNYGSVVSMNRDVVPYLTDEGVKCSPKDYLRNGDIVIADTAEDEIAGKVVEIQGVGERKVVSGLHTVFCRPKDADMFAPGWLGYWMNSSGYHDQLISMMTGIKVLSLSRGNFRKTYVCVPKRDEQERIVAAFDDADALIGNMEKRIAKRKLIKQGMMQQLLTGAVRLPGFAGEWVEKSLAKTGKTYGGISGKSAGDFGHGNGRYVTFLNVLNNTVIDSSIFENVDIEPNEKQHRVLKGDLLFNTSSETPEEVGFCSLVNGDYGDLYLNSFCFGYRLDDPSLDGLFLAYWFRGKEGRAVMTLMAQGCTRYNLSKERFNAISIKVPPALAEQQAIAAVLTDMDSEIAVLEKKLRKYRQLKSGMMSELLTGKVRLTEGN